MIINGKARNIPPQRQACAFPGAHKDGSKKIEVSKVVPLGEHSDIGEFCADYIIGKGGKTLMDQLQRSDRNTNIYSTKKLTDGQLQLFHNNVVADSNDAIKISLLCYWQNFFPWNTDHDIFPTWLKTAGA